jgi:hypothetical protein
MAHVLDRADHLANAAGIAGALALDLAVMRRTSRSAR